MTDLPISGMLDVTIDEASLRAAQQQIEDEVGDLSVGVEGRAGGRSGNVAGREQAMARRLATEGNEIAESQLEELELIYERVDEIADTQGGGIVAGDGILGLLTDVGGDAVGEGVGAGALTGAAGALSGAAASLSGAAAALAGSAALDGLSDIIDGLTGRGSNSGSVKKPEWMPIEVEDVGDLSVDEPDWAPLQVQEPTLSVDDPSPLSVVSDPLPVDRDPLPVEPVDVTVSMSAGSNEPSGSQSVPPAGGNVGLATPGIGHYISDNASTGGSMLPIAGDLVGGLFGLGRGIGAQLSGQSGELDPEAAGYRGNPESEEQRQRILQQRRDQFWTPESNSSQPQGEASRNEITVNVDQNVEVSANTQSLRREIMRETEAMVDDVQRQLDQLERDIANGG